MTAASIKGRFLFGTDAATSIPNLNGAGSLTYTAGSGGATFHSNYVDLGTGSRFTTPFTSTPRNRTIIIVANVPVWERVLDSDDTLKWPPTVAEAAAMRLSGDLLVAWPSQGFLGVTSALLWRAEAGGDNLSGTYDRIHTPKAYKDATFTMMPQIFVLGHGPTKADCYLGMQSGRNMAWLMSAGDYSGSASPAEATVFGNTTYGAGAGSQALGHTFLLGYAEYGYLTQAEALAEVTDMVTLLEARGWTGVFHNPAKSEAAPVIVSPTNALGLVVGAAFTRTFTGSGGTAPYTFAQDGGTIPPGLSLVGAVLSGTPTTEAAYTFGIKATDANGAVSGTVTFSGNVAAAPVAQPSITAENANFTVADSPVTGYKRITKVGGTSGTLERAASTTQLQPGWNVNIQHSGTGAEFIAGVANVGGPYLLDGIVGYYQSAAGTSTLGKREKGFTGETTPFVSGSNYSVARGSDGYIKLYLGTDPSAASILTHFGMGASDAAQGAVLSVGLSVIGEYIDVKIA